MEAAERSLFEHLAVADGDAAQAPVLFVLGSPRTGSTLFFQALVRAFRMPYLCNLANDAFASAPALVAPMLHHVLPTLDITFTSAYGKTSGAFQPSEGSGVMRRWCGGGHPSQLKSTAVLSDQRSHMTQTLAAYAKIFGKPLVIKNAWNCFRIRDLAEQFPRAYFLWIRRDLEKSAISDLAARYIVQKDPLVWNSATPARVEELSKLPYWAQVVENQYEFSRAISEAFERYAPQSHGVYWYEDFLAAPQQVLERISRDLTPHFGDTRAEPIELQPAERSPRPLQPGDEESLKRYVAEHAPRFQSLRYAA